MTLHADAKATAFPHPPRRSHLSTAPPPGQCLPRAPSRNTRRKAPGSPGWTTGRLHAETMKPP